MRSRRSRWVLISERSVLNGTIAEFISNAPRDLCSVIQSARNKAI